MKIVNFYCDGASYNNGSKNKDLDVLGSYGAFMTTENNDILFKFSEVFEDVTNNQMELYGFIKLFSEFYKRYNKNNGSKYTINVVSDSQYLIKGITEWMPNWKRKGWKNSTGKVVENLNLWKIINKIINLNENITFNFIWQKGHKGKNIDKTKNVYIYFNEMCDSTATESLSNYRNNKEYITLESFIDVINKIDKNLE